MKKIDFLSTVLFHIEVWRDWMLLSFKLWMLPKQECWPWSVSNVWCCVLLLLVINLCKYLLKITNLLFQTVYWIRIFRFIRNSLSVFIDISAWPLSKSSSKLPSILLFFHLELSLCWTLFEVEMLSNHWFALSGVVLYQLWLKLWFC